MSKRPEETLRDGNLKASIWRNEGDNGPYFSTSFARTYKDEEGKYHDTHSFNSHELLRVGELARQAHHTTNELWREHMQSHAPEPDQDTRDDRLRSFAESRTRDQNPEPSNERDR